MAQIKMKGNSAELIGRHYEGTVKVDGAGKQFLKENASSIYYDGNQGTWRVGSNGTSTTLGRAMFKTVTGRKADGRVRYANGDNTDFRAVNLAS